MTSSVRIIKIVKDPMSGDEAFTIEFECIAEESSDLMKELSKTPLGKQTIELLNKANFLPKEEIKTEEDLRLEAEEEEKAINEREEKLREQGRNLGREEIRERFHKYFRRKYGLEKSE